MSPPCQVQALALGGGWSCCSHWAQGQCQPGAAESRTPTKVACSLPPGQFADEARVCPVGQAQCPACGGVQRRSGPTRSVPSRLGGWPALWLRARTPVPGGRKQRVWRLPGAEQADWLPLRRERPGLACWGPWNLVLEQRPPAALFIPGHRGEFPPRGCYWL